MTSSMVAKIGGRFVLVALLSKCISLALSIRLRCKRNWFIFVDLMSIQEKTTNTKYYADYMVFVGIKAWTSAGGGASSEEMHHRTPRKVPWTLQESRYVNFVFRSFVITHISDGNFVLYSPVSLCRYFESSHTFSRNYSKESIPIKPYRSHNLLSSPRSLNVTEPSRGGSGLLHVRPQR